MTWRRQGSGLYLREGSGLALPGRRPFLHPIPGIIASAQMSGGDGGGGGGYPWSPTDVAGLLFWWRPDAGVTLSGSDITSVEDQSPNNRDGTGAGQGSAKPTLVSNYVGGLPAFRFNGGGLISGSWLALPTNTFSGETEAHIFFALELDDDPAGAAADSGLWRLSPQDFDSHLVYTDGHIYDGFGGETRFDFGDPASSLADAWHHFDVQAAAGAGGLKWFINGTQQGSSQTGDGSSWDANPVIGASSGDHANKAHWLDVFMYDHVLTGADLTAARTYLADRISGEWVSQGGDG